VPSCFIFEVRIPVNFSQASLEPESSCLFLPSSWDYMHTFF